MSHATAQTSRLTTLSLQGCQHTLLRQYRRPGPRHSCQCARAAAPLRHQRVCCSIGSSQVKIEPFPFVFLLKLPISPSDCPPLPSRPPIHSPHVLPPTASSLGSFSFSLLARSESWTLRLCICRRAFTFIFFVAWLRRVFRNPLPPVPSRYFFLAMMSSLFNSFPLVLPSSCAPRTGGWHSEGVDADCGVLASGLCDCSYRCVSVSVSVSVLLTVCLQVCCVRFP